MNINGLLTILDKEKKDIRLFFTMKRGIIRERQGIDDAI